MAATNIISISGGKDSTAIAHLALEKSHDNLRFVFADTSHEHLLIVCIAVMAGWMR